MITKCLAAFAITITALSCAGDAATAQGRWTKRSCIQGVATASPVVATQSIRKPDGPESMPLSRAIISIRKRSNGHEVARTRADRNGFYKVNVPPGEYIVVGLPPNPKDILPRGETKSATVRPRICTNVNLLFDTGIRF
ncbi:MAG: hypothetical protein K2W95_08855 [Candidatus Obscuribacterales bacterium]|nr:hypothetical protein [Candidatus Obscuribacterales bacterium]